VSAAGRSFLDNASEQDGLHIHPISQTLLARAVRVVENEVVLLLRWDRRF
jgi:hypothetical protein